MKVVFAIAIILSIFAFVSCYDCTKENGNRSKKDSLKGWTPKAEEDYQKTHRNCLVRHLASNYVDLAKCIDKKTGVIDETGCYLIPRAVEQYDKVFDIKKSDIDKTVKKCYNDNFAGGVLDYATYYKCIETIN